MDAATGTARVGLIQFNPIVGDLSGNTDRIIAALHQADEAGCDVAVFPKLAVTGYPLEGLALKPSFERDNLRCIDRIAAAQAGLRCVAVVGYLGTGGDVSGAAIIAGGRPVGAAGGLPAPGADAAGAPAGRDAGRRLVTFEVRGVRYGVCVCDTIQPSEGLGGEVDVILSPGATSFQVGAREEHERYLSDHARGNSAFLCRANAVGGQDDAVLDGRSLFFDPAGECVGRGPSFEEAMVIADLPIDVRSDATGRTAEHRTAVPIHHLTLPEPETAGDATRGGASGPPLPILINAVAEPLPPLDAIYRCLTLAVRDYARKNGFTDAVLGLSGGIDSALVAAIAVDALGPDRVVGVTMPSRFTSDETRSDAGLLAANLGIRFLTLPIEGPYRATLEALAVPLKDTAFGVAQENLQARIRANYLMTLSNEFGWLVLTTGNKSEAAVGYATLYGDMAGGFAVLKDIPKTLVYALSERRNAQSPVIPASTIARVPSAELRPDQKDTDSLPPYDVLDDILRLYREDGLGAEAIAREGYDEALVRRVMAMVDRAEYKRRQAPPGPRVTSSEAAWRRTQPITNRYRES